MCDSIAAMRNARKAPHRYLSNYLNLRSRIGADIFICIFEGYEDLPVYDAWIRGISTERYEPLPVNGKENVLDLNVLIKELKSNFDHRLLFFADADFDGAKGRAIDDRCYITSVYSIENYLVCESTLEEILKREFRMIGEEQPNRASVIALFNNRFGELNQEILTANAYVKWLRSENVDCKLPSTISEFINVSLEKVSKKPMVTLNDICSIFKAMGMPLPSVLTIIEGELKINNLSLVGRGKFVLDFFKRFLGLLYVDRRSENPKYFPKKDSACADPCHELMRKLATYTSCPKCLESFLRKAFGLATI